MDLNINSSIDEIESAIKKLKISFLRWDKLAEYIAEEKTDQEISLKMKIDMKNMPEIRKIYNILKIQITEQMKNMKSFESIDYDK